MAKYAPNKALKKLITHLVTLYNTDSENEESRFVSATTFIELARRSPDAVKVIFFIFFE